MRAARIVVGAVIVALLGQATALAATGHAPSKPSSGPAPTQATYVVHPGDNLETIAKRFQTTVSALVAANQVRNKNIIVIGTRLRIPLPAPAANLPARLRAHPDRLALAPRFDYWANRYSVPPDLLKALAWYESGWQNSVVSSTGAVGVGQLEPWTSDFVADVLLKNPSLTPQKVDDNIRMSARFLRFLLDQTGGAAGLARTQQGKFFEDTKRYVAGVSATRQHFRNVG